jgi:hypothetical protein
MFERIKPQSAWCFKKSFTTLKAFIHIRIRRSVLTCDNEAIYTQFYLGKLRFNLTSNGNAGSFKKSSKLVLQMLLCGDCYENV